MALTESSDRGPSRVLWLRAADAVRAWLNDHSDNSRAQRAAGTAFAIRVASAALVYLTQVLFARWMGTFEFGVYAYVWTWVLLLGGVIDLGLASSAQRFIPEYMGSRQFELPGAHVFGDFSPARAGWCSRSQPAGRCSPPSWCGCLASACIPMR